MTASAELYGFPSGYFVIRNVANGRLWDVGGDDVEDGIEILLWPEKDKSLVESGFTFCGAHKPTLTKYQP
jgi:hypothetical protein